MPRANPMKGEIVLGEHVLRMDFGAWIAFEEKTGRDLPDHLSDLARGLSCIELVGWIEAFCAAELSRDEVIALIDRAGFPQTLEALDGAAKRFFGKMVEDNEGNPPPAA